MQNTNQTIDKTKNYADTLRLHEKMMNMGYTIPKLAKAAGIAVSTLRSKMNGRGHFDIVEQTQLSRVLQMTKQENYEIFTLPYEQLFNFIYEK